LLTGPYRAISAEGSISIEFDLYNDREQQDPSKPVSEPWDVYSKDAVYDQPITKKVRTSYGQVEATYIVWNNAAEGFLRMRLVHRDGADPDDCIHGRITAGYSKFPGTEVVLFDSDSDSVGTCTKPRQ
jgi:hypothetical protein